MKTFDQIYQKILSESILILQDDGSVQDKSFKINIFKTIFENYNNLNKHNNLNKPNNIQLITKAKAEANDNVEKSIKAKANDNVEKFIKAIEKLKKINQDSNNSKTDSNNSKTDFNGLEENLKMFKTNINKSPLDFSELQRNINSIKKNINYICQNDIKYIDNINYIINHINAQKSLQDFIKSKSEKKNKLDKSDNISSDLIAKRINIFKACMINNGDGDKLSGNIDSQIIKICKNKQFFNSGTEITVSDLNNAWINYNNFINKYKNNNLYKKLNLGKQLGKVSNLKGKNDWIVTGTGNGQLFINFIMDKSSPPQGLSNSFDIDIEGKHYQVKSYKKGNSIIRLGKEGIITKFNKLLKIQDLLRCFIIY